MVRQDTTELGQPNDAGLLLEEVAFPFRLETPKSAPCDEQSGRMDLFQRKGNAAAIERRLVPVRQMDMNAIPHAAGSAETIDVGSLLREAKDELARRIHINLEEDIEDAVASGEIGPSNDAVEACLRLAKRVAPHVALAPRLKCAAFVEEDGVVALVLQSLVTDRRLTCRFSADGSTMVVHRLNEAMEAHQVALATDAAHAREIAEWVTKRA